MGETSRDGDAGNPDGDAGNPDGAPSLSGMWVPGQRAHSLGGGLGYTPVDFLATAMASTSGSAAWTAAQFVTDLQHSVHL